MLEFVFFIFCVYKVGVQIMRRAMK